MKKKFSTSWVSSKQTRKQRKYRHNAPLHILHKFVSATLSKELKKRHKKNSVPLRKNDVVVVMRGKFSKKEGKVKEISLKRQRIKIEGVNIAKKDGTNVDVSFNPSNLMIKELYLEDKERLSNADKPKKTENKEDAPENKRSA